MVKLKLILYNGIEKYRRDQTHIYQKTLTNGKVFKEGRGKREETSDNREKRIEKIHDVAAVARGHSAIADNMHEQHQHTPQ